MRTAGAPCGGMPRAHHLLRVVLDCHGGELPRPLHDGGVGGVDARLAHGHLEQRLAERYHPRLQPRVRQRALLNRVRLYERFAYLGRAVLWQISPGRDVGGAARSLTSALSSAGSE